MSKQYDVQLNHIYLVVDKGTYEAIKNSEFIRSFAFTYEQKNGADHQVSWEAFYIRGKNTFIELFYPQKRYPLIGISGIGLGVDSKGALDALEAKLKKELPELTKGSFRRQGKPWFDYLAVNDGYFYERNSCWIMEYASENSNDVSRDHYNKEKYDSTKPFLDIQCFDIALHPKAIAILSSYLKSFGLRNEGNACLTSEDVKIQLLQEDKHRKGICQITILLNQPFEENYSCRLGNSLLKIHGDKGIWTFLK